MAKRSPYQRQFDKTREIVRETEEDSRNVNGVEFGLEKVRKYPELASTDTSYDDIVRTHLAMMNQEEDKARDAEDGGDEDEYPYETFEEKIGGIKAQTRPERGVGGADRRMSSRNQELENEYHDMFKDNKVDYNQAQANLKAREILGSTEQDNRTYTNFEPMAQEMARMTNVPYKEFKRTYKPSEDDWKEQFLAGRSKRKR